MAKVAETGLMLPADKYEDFTSQMGAPVDILVATMNKYNQDMEAIGVDGVMRVPISTTTVLPRPRSTTPPLLPSR